MYKVALEKDKVTGIIIPWWISQAGTHVYKNSHGYPAQRESLVPWNIPLFIYSCLNLLVQGWYFIFWKITLGFLRVVLWKHCLHVLRLQAKASALFHPMIVPIMIRPPIIYHQDLILLNYSSLSFDKCKCMHSSPPVLVPASWLSPFFSFF